MADKAPDKLKPGDTVRLHSDDLTQAANAPMVVVLIKSGEHGATAVCNRQGRPAGEYSLEALEKVATPVDAAAEAKKAAEAAAPKPAEPPKATGFMGKKK
jgi:hypothetical protein